MQIILVLLLSVLVLPLTALILNWLAARFKVVGANYKLALKLDFFRYAIVLVVALVLSLIFQDQLILTALSSAVSIGAFVYLARRLYKINYKKIVLLFVSWQFAVALVGALVAIFIRAFIFIPFYISGDSMEPNLKSGDYVLIKRFDHGYQRGNIIVMTQPDKPGAYMVKRIIALPGEKLIIKPSGLFLVTATDAKGIKIDEPYLATGTKTAPSGKTTFLIPDGQYFVLGDNRKTSEDSRDFGPIDKSKIVGQLWFDLGPQK